MGRVLRALWRLAKAVAVVAAVVAGLVWVSKRRAREEPAVAPPVWPPLPVDDVVSAEQEAVAEAAVQGVAEAVAASPADVALAPDPVGAEETTAPDGADPRLDTGEPVIWVLPKDGACPDGYPVKAKLASGIFHVPGGTSYARTTPDRCYATSADAEADGFRPAKR